MLLKERSTRVYHQERLFTEEELFAREWRCVHEEPAYCNAACPLKMNMKEIIRLAAAGDFSGAWAVYHKSAPLPNILAAGCEASCRCACKLGQLGEPVRIGALERAIVKWGRPDKAKAILRVKKKKTAAVFGTGLFAAFYLAELARKAYPLTVYSPYASGTEFLAAAAPWASAEAVAGDAVLLTGSGVKFIQVETFTPELLAAERTKYDLAAVAPDAWSKLSGVQADEKLMLCRELNLVACEREKGVLDSALAARKAAVTADRLAQGLAPENSRGEEGCTATRLFTNLEGLTAAEPVAEEAGGYTKEQAVAEAKRCLQCHCDECIRHCAYLQHYNKSPKKLTREIYNNANIIMGDHMMNKPLNACALCGQCKVVCPNGYDLSEVFLRARQNMVRTEKMSLAYHEFALLDENFSNTEAFLCRPQPGFSTCRYVFFPGCQAAALAPDIVQAAYRDLTQRLPGGVGLLLGCCGAISHWAGRQDLYQQTAAFLKEQVAALGNPELIAGCPTCARMWREQAGLKVTGIWEVLNEIGLPGQARGLDHPVALHDSCGARGDLPAQQAVRLLADKLGCTVTESPYAGDRSPCCGYGGLVMYTHQEVAHKMAAFLAGHSEAPTLTYCMACRDRLIEAGKEAYHLLELVYGVPAGSSPDISKKRFNRIKLKDTLLQEFWKEEPEEMKVDFIVNYTPEAQKIMAERMILDSDVIQTLEHMRETGEAVLEEDTGLLATRHRLGNVTFWVKYKQQDGGYLVHSAYSHRMEIVTR